MGSKINRQVIICDSLQSTAEQLPMSEEAMLSVVLATNSSIGFTVPWKYV